MAGRGRLRRLADNERVLREANEEIEREVVGDVQGREARRAETEIEFFCACGRANCDERILLTLGEYEAAHEEPHRFVVAHGHVTSAVERVAEEHPRYDVVEKRPEFHAEDE